MKQGMIKLSVLYPNGEGTKFDIHYYLNTHIPLVAKLLGDAVKGATVEEGIASVAPNSKAPFAAMGNLYFETLESFQNSFGPNAAEILADLPNFTNIAPTVQVSKVMA
ncbi:EthD family reductase [Polaribacter litorisediminis]|uniref:EthD family reductase n=1 Tax=Polaribacter litorisediminis TaxID=1908341 RepID=UPI001CBD67BA|nr:EthD family reductase [Polaribacter litorisediminis]UAM98607.1 EthD family reductase [Polaribacter litorisediminis]